MNQTFIDSQWTALCDSAHSSAARLSQDVSPHVAELMRSQARKLCALDPPVDKPSLEDMYTRRMALSARLTAIARADAMSRKHSEAASDVYAQLEQFCDGDFPCTSDAYLQMQIANVELTRAVASLCEADMAARR